LNRYAGKDGRCKAACVPYCTGGAGQCIIPLIFRHRKDISRIKSLTTYLEKGNNGDSDILFSGLNNSITFFVGDYAFSTHDTHSELCDAIRIIKGYRREKWGYFLRAESFYNVAAQEEEYADIKHPSAGYHEKSHGESFLALAQNNLRACGLYLLDEPEAALSPQRQLTLLTDKADILLLLIQ